MFRFRIVCLLLAMASLLVFGGTALAAEVDCDSAYCFSAGDLAENTELAGVCITQLPEAKTGTVMLGSRVVQPGDILTAQQVEMLTFHPVRTEQDQDAVLTYLPIYDDRVEAQTTFTLSIKGKEDKAPVAEDSAIETYKNLPNEGKLSVSDPEGEMLKYTLMRQPKRGTVQIREDGTFVYTPKKNKVGVDSFTYTATDPAGKVSREATVTVQILKPADARQYTDTVGQSCRFAAEWMRNTGLFVGERIGGQDCFQPEKTVSQGEFVAMLVKALEIPMEESAVSAVPEDVPQWLKPYYAAALRSGLTAGLESEDSSFAADMPITGAQVAVMLQNALDLDISREVLEQTQSVNAQQEQTVPAWAEVSLTAMAENGINLDANAPLTRGQLAQVMYQVADLALDAPGMAVLRLHK